MMLRYLHARAVGVVAACAIVLAACTAGGDVPPPPCSPTQGADIGISADAKVLDYQAAELDRYMSAVRASGASWFRVAVDWSRIERTRGRLDWSASDRVLAAAQRHGLRVLGLVSYTPVWARTPAAGPSDTHGYPADPETFGDFARAAATRYFAQVDTWEIWNEPNIEEFFSPAPDVAIYTALLRAASTAIHAIQPHATVLSGGLAPATDTAPDISPPTFVEQLYNSGANRWFDGVAIHPYVYPALPSSPGSASYNTFQRMQLIRTSMLTGGDAAKKVWITEFGAPTSTAPRGVSADAQAASITEAVDLARRLGYVPVLFVYTLVDGGTDGRDVEDNFGLLTTDRSPKPAYLAVQRAANRHCP